MCGANHWLCQCYIGSLYFGLMRTSWESSPASPRAGSGSRGEFLSLLKQNCQPEFLPLDYKEGRSLALLFCKVPGYVYEVTYYYSWKVKQLLNVTDRPIFPVLHGFHMDQCSWCCTAGEGQREVLVLDRIVVLLVIIECNVVEHLVVKV